MTTTAFTLDSYYKQTWYKPSASIIDSGNLIQPSPNATIELYYPFKYYNDYIPLDSVAYILGKDSATDFKLHTLFASLDPQNSDMLLRWVNVFGLPFATYTKKGTRLPRAITFPRMSPIELTESTGLELHEDWLYMDHFSFEVTRFSKMMLLYAAVQAKDYTFLEDNYHQTQSGINPLYDISFIQNDSGIRESEIHKNDLVQGILPVQGIEDKNQATIMKSALYDLEFIMNVALEGTRPSLSFLGSTQKEYQLQAHWRWEYSSLLSLIYLMAFLDWQQGALIRKCQNTKCGNIFLASRADKAYCSIDCQRIHKQQRYRDRIKKKDM